jgi:hypothetical protein
MTADNFDKLVNSFCDRKPFRPFQVELITGERFEVDSARAVTNRDGVAVFTKPGGVPVYFDHESVTQFIDNLADVPA